MFGEGGLAVYFRVSPFFVERFGGGGFARGHKSTSCYGSSSRRGSWALALWWSTATKRTKVNSTSELNDKDLTLPSLGFGFGFGPCVFACLAR